MEDFDKEEVYDEQIFPLMEKILDVCKENDLPMLASFCYRIDGEVYSFCTSQIVTESGWVPEQFDACHQILFSSLPGFKFDRHTEN